MRREEQTNEKENKTTKHKSTRGSKSQKLERQFRDQKRMTKSYTMVPTEHTMVPSKGTVG